MRVGGSGRAGVAVGPGQAAPEPLVKLPLELVLGGGGRGVSYYGNQGFIFISSYHQGYNENDK